MLSGWTWDREIAEVFADNGFTVDGKSYSSAKDKKAAVDKLVEVVRTLVIGDVTIGKMKLRDYYVGHMDNIYGVLVEEAFKDQFGEYIQLQDVINDTFKITFRQFEVALNKELDKLALSNRKVTEAEYKELISRLWDKFPVVKGPMTKVIEGINYDVIPVTDNGSAPNDTGVILRDRAQTAVKEAGKDTKSVTVYAVMKFLKEASKAGSVLPFHYIDGAELGRTVNEMHSSYDGVGFTPIHDAIMAPLNMFDEVTFNYNKNVVSTNEEYVLMDSIADLASTWNFETMDNNSKAIGLNVAKKAEMGLKEAAQRVKAAVLDAQELVREEGERSI